MIEKMALYYLRSRELVTTENVTSIAASILQGSFQVQPRSVHIRFQLARPLVERLLDHVHRLVWTVLSCSFKCWRYTIDLHGLLDARRRASTSFQKSYANRRAPTFKHCSFCHEFIA